MNSIHAFLSLYTTEILTILDVHSIIIYNNNIYTDYKVYGDASIIPTIEGYDILNKRCKMNSIYPSNKFEQYLEGNGAGCIFFKNNYITIACIRRCLYRYVILLLYYYTKLMHKYACTVLCCTHHICMLIIYYYTLDIYIHIRIHILYLYKSYLFYT